jgi:hypothetical protein
MLKDEILKIKNNEKTFFARKNSKVNLLKNEIADFCDNIGYTNLSFMNKIRFILDDLIDLYIGSFKDVFVKHLIRNDGRINSPKLKNVHVKHFLERVYSHHNKLKEYNVEHLWFYIKNDLTEIPTCDGCGIILEKFVWGNRFCTQNCAATSEEARERSSRTSTGRKMTDKVKKKMSENVKQRWKSVTFRNKIIPILKEANKHNGKHFLNENGRPWNFGIDMPREIIEKSLNTKKKKGISYKGKNNPQYGKSPSPKAGRGINGRFKKVWFRSSLELFYLMYFDYYQIEFRTAETKEFEVEFRINDSTHIYKPDFFIESTEMIYEIKPLKRTKEKINILKMNALKNKFGSSKCKFMTEYEIKDFIERLNIDCINDIINNNKLIIDFKQKTRLISSFKRIKYDTLRDI